MSAMDDLKAAGFSENEIGDYATQQRQTLAGAGFTNDEINQHMGTRQPNMAIGNQSFSRVLGDALSSAATKLKPAGETIADVGSVYAPIEAALNAGTGLLFGFPAQLTTGLGGLVAKHALGMDVDPAEMAENMRKVFTYEPITQRGKHLTGNVNDFLGMYGAPSEVGHWVNNTATKLNASTDVASALGSVTEQTVGLLPFILSGELARKMGGQTIGKEDMTNVAKAIGGDQPAHVAAAEESLHSVYDKTGIGPYTILEAAKNDPALHADLVDPKVDVPKALEQYVQKPAETAPTAENITGPTAEEIMHGDGAPLLDVSGGETKQGPGGVNEPVSATVYDKNGTSIELEREFKGKYNFKIDGQDAGSIIYTDTNTGGFKVSGVDVKPEFQRRGIASAVYDFLEQQVIGKPFDGTGGQSAAGAAFRAARKGSNGEISYSDERLPVVDAATEMKNVGEITNNQFSKTKYFGDQASFKFAINDSGKPTSRKFTQITLPDFSEDLEMFVDKSGNIFTGKGTKVDPLRLATEQEISTAKQKMSDVYLSVRAKALENRNRFDAPIEDLANQAAEMGLSVRINYPDDSTSRYIYATRADGAQTKIRIADHAQPWEGGKVVGGFSQKTGVRHSASDLSIDPETKLTNSDAVAYLQKFADDYKPQESSTTELNAGLNPTAARDVVRGIIQSNVVNEVGKAILPMSTGSMNAKAAAQHFANAMRLARFQWGRMSEYIKDTFTSEERMTMWNAADEQNTLMLRGEDTVGRGIERLTPAQQHIMNEMHGLSVGLWKRAQDAGMVTGEGMPYWTPRTIVMMMEDGTIETPRSQGKGASATSAGEGGNVKTTTPNLKQRKYVQAEDTEAAAKAKLGENAELVRDILTMPLAMQRMGEAIAGRELVNQLKELGQVSGDEILSDSMKPGFVTINHPAFTRYQPDFITDTEGKTFPRVDQNGDMVMQKLPMFINPEWEGPLKAVMSTRDGTLYRAYMLMKGKAMSMIMIAPSAHQMVIFGRALAYDPVKVGTLQAYYSGHALAKDTSLVLRAIQDGQVPMGANRHSMMDITDVARGIGKQGGWGDPHENWSALSSRLVGNFFHEGFGDAMKQRIDSFWEFWEHDMLWKHVGALQLHIYNDYYNHMIEQGHPPEVAGPVAANLSNRYGGAVANENTSELVRKAMNVLLFSRSFNQGNIGAVHDAVFGLPAGLEAKMRVEAGTAAADAGLAQATFKARAGLVADLGMSMLMTGIASAAVMKLLQNQTIDDIKNGYSRRLSAMFGNIAEHPEDITSYNPYRALPTWDNEPDKRDRIDLGVTSSGRHEYLRLPTGKVVEDTVGWLIHAPDTFVKKMSPMAKGVWQAVTNDKGYGVPVENPEGNTLQHIAQGMEHVIKAQVPYDTMKTLYDVMSGHGTDLDKQKLAGFATGFTTSQGNPHGPEAAAYYAQQDRVTAMQKYAMEEVRDYVKRGEDAKAFDRLRAIGIPAREAQHIINNIKEPRQGLSRSQARKFYQEQNAEDAANMESAKRTEDATQ